MATMTADVFSSLKGRIKEHYDDCSTYYENLWGEHIHHGYFLTPTDTKELAQRQLIQLLLERAALPSSSSSKPSFLSDSGSDVTVLDVGCGIGGTTRYLASENGWNVTGVTISDVQVSMAYDLSRKAASTSTTASTNPTPALTPDSSLSRHNSEDRDLKQPKVALGNGSVRFQTLDAELIDSNFPHDSFNLVWISEALSHLPNKSKFFKDAETLLQPGGRLIIADWIKAEDLTAEQKISDIDPIEKGMLLPPLSTASGYVNLAQDAGLVLVDEVMDISDKVAKTWDISLSLVSSPSLWALAFSRGMDFVEFLRAFQAMRRGFANQTFKYGVFVFEKSEKA